MKLAFVAKLQSGKDTSVDYLKLNYGGSIAKFANRLYKIHDSTMEIMELPKTKDRNFLQLVGTEWGRARDPEMWIKAFEQDYALVSDTLFCSDARFLSEFLLLKKMGFTIVKIERPLLKRLTSEFKRQVLTSEFLKKHPILGYGKILWAMWKQSRHKSEKGVNKYKDYDYTIKNTGSIQELFIKVDKIYSEVKAKSVSRSDIYGSFFESYARVKTTTKF